eukprot:4934387-Prymnesium_polylepis.2
MSVLPALAITDILPALAITDTADRDDSHEKGESSSRCSVRRCAIGPAMPMRWPMSSIPMYTIAPYLYILRFIYSHGL